jgi:hypothetical protein
MLENYLPCLQTGCADGTVNPLYPTAFCIAEKLTKVFYSSGIRIWNIPRSGYLLTEEMPDVLFAPPGGLPLI